MERIVDWVLKVFGEFYNTVVYDGRYMLLLRGLEKTIIISFGAVLLGIIIGGLVSIIRYTYKNKKIFKFLNKLCNLYVGVIRGTPVLLQLMIIYYVIFRTSSISPIIVGILAFGLNSGAYCAEIFRSGFDSVDDGQMEAGLSLGLSYTKTLIHIIIPQAVKISLPSMGNELVTMIKETSIVGYIGILDLTKASDTIASRTYNYFFPLIIVALIYLFLTTIISKVMKSIERKLDINDTSK